MVGDDGLAQTFEARDLGLDRMVSIRMLTEDAAANPVLVRRFINEARVASQLVHPAIPAVLEVRGAQGYVHTAIEGPTLAVVLAEARDALGSRRPLPPRAARDVLVRQMIAVCDAVAYAHDRGVLHRDLRPEAIVLGAHGAVWVLDWGIARALINASSPVKFEPLDEDPRVLIGTPGYCSPEQSNGNHAALDGRSDVYALGLILYEILTLRPAVSGISPAAKLARQQQGQIDPFAHAYGAPIPASLRDVALRALSVHPDDRFATASAMAEALRRALQGEGDGLLARTGRAAGQHPVLLIALMVALGSGWLFALVAVVLAFL
jgi:serine/threonine-protein kinase